MPRDVASSATPAAASQAALGQATALHRAGRFKEAEALLRDACDQDPDNERLLVARGVMLAAMKRPADAVSCYRAALARNDREASTWTNLGNALTRLNQFRTATACHRRAVALSGGQEALFHANLGMTLSEATRYGEAVAALTRALDVDPSYHAARWDRALAYLALGNLARGWKDYEVRKISGLLPRCELPGREWRGDPYPGQRLALISEQGFGDLFWVARYFARVKALGGELVIQCRPELLPLVAEMRVADAVVSRDAAPPAADLHCHLCSLPGLFTPDLAAIPPEPYLFAPQDRLARFADAFARAGRRRKVGIVWSGSTTFKNNHRRAQRLMQFAQAFALPGVQLYSLQKGPPTAELASLPPGMPIIDLAPLLEDFADTAAAVSQLDLVIMTDSAVAHLAGAMAKPVWVLLGHKAHWLWLTDRTDSPWYPSLKLFRPRADGDWDHVFDTASAELMSLVGSIG